MRFLKEEGKKGRRREGKREEKNFQACQKFNFLRFYLNFTAFYY